MASTEWIVIAIIAGAAALSKPADGSFERKINADLRQSFANPQATDDPVADLISLGCLFAPGDCADFAQSFVRYGTRDFVVAKLGAVKLGEAEMTCIGAFDNWWCWTPEEGDAQA